MNDRSQISDKFPLDSTAYNWLGIMFIMGILPTYRLRNGFHVYTISVNGNNKLVNGYNGFFTEYIFNDDGTLHELGIWE